MTTSVVQILFTRWQQMYFSGHRSKPYWYARVA